MASSMPNYFPLRPLLSRNVVLLACLALSSFAAHGQMLARPGWTAATSSASSQWSKHSIVYETAPNAFADSTGAGSLKGITQRLDYLQSLGVDAILLTRIQPATGDATRLAQVDPGYGTADDLDDLVHQASRVNLRVLMDLEQRPTTADTLAVARFWLNHGIAGFRLIPAAQSGPLAGAALSASNETLHAQVAELRKLVASFMGQRIVIAPADPAGSDAPAPRITKSNSRPGHTEVTLAYLPILPTPPPLTAASIRTGVEASQAALQRGTPLLATDAQDAPRSMARYGNGTNDLDIAKVVATALLSTPGTSLLYYGQELGLIAQTDAGAVPEFAAKQIATAEANPASLLSWYRHLGTFHHSNAAVTTGTLIPLNHDDQGIAAWVHQPQHVSLITPPVVVICNLTDKPVQLTLKADMAKLHLRGSFLKTVLRTDSASGPMHLDGMTIPPYGVYIGELKY